MSALPQHALASSDPAHPAGAILSTDCDLVGVLVEQDQRRLIAVRDIAAGTRIISLLGRETTIATRYSVQIGRDTHLDPDDVATPLERVRQRQWMYLNHHCAPNAWITDRALVALRDIASGEGVTFDYNTTEWDMASPFECHCGSGECVGTIRGAKYLSAERRAQVAAWLAPYFPTSA